VHISAKLFVKFQTEKKLLDFIHKNGFKTLMPNTSANTPMLSKNSNFYCISVFDPKCAIDFERCGPLSLVTTTCSLGLQSNYFVKPHLR